MVEIASCGFILDISNGSVNSLLHASGGKCPTTEKADAFVVKKKSAEYFLKIRRHGWAPVGLFLLILYASN